MTVELPEPFVASGATLADATEVAELIRAAESAQDGEVETTVDDVREDWVSSDLACDVILVRETGRVVAYGHVNDLAGQRLLEEEGYVGVRRWLRMLVDLEEEPVAPGVPGVEIRPFRPGEERAFHETFERAFEGHWGHVPQSFQEWWPRLERGSGGDLTYLFVAERDGELVGETSGTVRRFGMGWIRSLGVVPEERGLGIGRALLLRSLAEFWANGERRVGLGVDAGNETGATRLYESVGMRTSFGAITYEKDLAAGTVST